ncbi:NAD(+) diphosphatase [Erythrobacteraceae bacterium CFH 75059]|uniref:NAD(+) diphosphatase n=1 Tax=Qipengyuania thermophila TaxID=2509361 RepID=UPI001020E124|nr:NAD(+) diphosphatase [Qipengyuania thermophila]TCD04884.1 NAD(+) diphosphatase [Erythrobacteraceae bacterium CFH 75059]
MTLAFAGAPLDRADRLRNDDEALRRLVTGAARLLMLDGLAPVPAADGGLCWDSPGNAPPDSELVFLGLLDGRACFAAVPEHGAGGPAYAQPAIWAAMQTLSPSELAIYGAARSLVDWHARHRFCARCGARTRLARGGWQRACAACGADHFPRTDPVTIMLVEHDDAVLLGRQHRFPPGVFSALAGFVEPGETIEEAVAREVEEEAGLQVRKVRYIASQPWPFPSQLMIGCHALAAGRDLHVDGAELEEARWFTRAEVAAALSQATTPHREIGNPPFRPPPPAAIAHALLRWWVDGARR